MRPGGCPPTPIATSSDRQPEGITATGSTGPPRRMIALSPWLLRMLASSSSMLSLLAIIRLWARSDLLQDGLEVVVVLDHLLSRVCCSSVRCYRHAHRARRLAQIHLI